MNESYNNLAYNQYVNGIDQLGNRKLSDYFVYRDFKAFISMWAEFNSENAATSFVNFLNGEEISTSEYRKLRIEIFQKKLKIKTQNLKIEEIRKKAYELLINSFIGINEKIDNQYYMSFPIYKPLVKNYFNYILDANTYQKNYEGPSNNIYLTNDNRGPLHYSGKVPVSEDSERNIMINDIDEDDSIEIDYKKIIEIRFDHLIVTYENLIVENSSLNSEESLPISDGVFISYNINHEESDYAVLANINVTTYNEDKDWHLYLAEAYKHYNQSEYKISFMLNFIAFEALIEEICYNLKEFSRTMAINTLSYDRKENAKYEKMYDKFSNKERSLVDDKLEDILKYYIKLKSKISPSNCVHELNLEKTKIIKEMNLIVKIRNEFVHGININETEYYELSNKLITTMVTFLLFIRGEKLTTAILSNQP